MGPMIDGASARRVDALVAAAADYASVIVRGGLAEGAEDSAYYRPSLVEVSELDSPSLAAADLLGRERESAS